MGYGWPEVTIAEVAQPVERLVEPIPGVMYRQVGVRLWGHGAYEREAIDGAATKYKSLNCVEAGDIIVNKIWARNGSVGVVTDDLAGGHGSGEFPTFAVDPERLLPRWFHCATRTRWFWQRCDLQSQGTSGKNRIRPEKFLAIRIPLPPLSEQRRIVAKIDRLAEKIEEARELRESGATETSILMYNQVGEVFKALANRYGVRSFGSFNPHVTSGPRNWGKYYTSEGLRFYRAQDIGPAGQVLEDGKVFVVPPEGDQGRGAFLAVGDLMVIITGATVGRCSVFTEGLEPGLVSQHVAICRLPNRAVCAKFALWGLRGPQGQEQLLGARYGQGKPGLNLTNIRSLELPFPSPAEQRRTVTYLDDLQAKVDAIKKLQEQSAAELDALLPSILDRAFKREL